MYEVGTAPRAVLGAKEEFTSGGGWQLRVAGGRNHSRVPGLGPRVSGTGYLVQVQVPGEIQIPYPKA